MRRPLGTGITNRRNEEVAIDTIELDSTNERISRIGFGAMQLSLRGRPPRDSAIGVLHRALDMGVTLIDTADSYCTGTDDMHHGERLVAEALEAYPGDTSDVVVATKGGLRRPEGRWVADCDPDRLRRTIRESFDALGGDEPIDLWQLHTVDNNHDVRASLEPAVEAAERGMIRHIGVSNFKIPDIERAREVVDPITVQNQWNPWHRAPEDDDVIDFCEDEGLTFFPWSPFSGQSTADAVADVPVLADVARARDTSPHRVLLAWMMAKSPAVVPIPGASRIETLEDSIRAVELELTDEEFERIDSELPGGEVNPAQ